MWQHLDLPARRLLCWLRERQRAGDTKYIIHMQDGSWRHASHPFVLEDMSFFREQDLVLPLLNIGMLEATSVGELKALQLSRAGTSMALTIAQLNSQKIKAA